MITVVRFLLVIPKLWTEHARKVANIIKKSEFQLTNLMTTLHYYKKYSNDRIAERATWMLEHLF